MLLAVAACSPTNKVQVCCLFCGAAITALQQMLVTVFNAARVALSAVVSPSAFDAEEAKRQAVLSKLGGDDTQLEAGLKASLQSSVRC